MPVVESEPALEFEPAFVPSPGVDPLFAASFPVASTWFAPVSVAGARVASERTSMLRATTVSPVTEPWSRSRIPLASDSIEPPVMLAPEPSIHRPDTLNRAMELNCEIVSSRFASLTDGASTDGSTIRRVARSGASAVEDWVPLTWTVDPISIELGSGPGTPVRSMSCRSMRSHAETQS